MKPYCVVTDRVSREYKAIGVYHVSVRLFPLYLLSRLTEILCVIVMTVARLRLKVKVMGQGQRSMSVA